MHLTVEMAPFAKVGGLGDVITGLSRALQERGHKLEVVLPKYDCILLDKLKNLRPLKQKLTFEFGKEILHSTLWRADFQNISLILIEDRSKHQFFNRGSIYGCKDDTRRFLYFTKACYAYLKKRRQKPDVLHIHDWQVAAVAPLCAIDTCKFPPVLLTIHNLFYQGVCSKEDLNLLQLPEKITTLMIDPKHKKCFNLMRGGIEFADYINTVSPTYAKEILTKEHGEGLAPLLRKHKKKLTGILNGVDYSYWSPELDPILPLEYSKTDPTNKLQLKKKLQKKRKLHRTDAPLFGCVTRLVAQKGLHLIEEAIRYATKKGGQFMLLGSTQDPKIKKRFTNLKKKYAPNHNVSFFLKHDELLAHMIFAGSDYFLVPSLFEPCGLTQLIALRYGSVPIVRRTGGLADTIHHDRNGLVFKSPTKKNLHSVLDRAFKYWYNPSSGWRRLSETGMYQDFSWKKSSHLYEKLYRKIKK